MKTLTIKQPWASLIVEGLKDIENRTWQTNYRGRILIHAGASKELTKQNFLFLNDSQMNQIVHENKTIELFGELLGSNLPHGAIIGSIEIIDCVQNHPSIWAEKTPSLYDQSYGEKPIYNWVLANPIKFPEPIPAKGKLSFWDYPNILAESEEENGELFCHCNIPVKEESQVVRTMNPLKPFQCRYCGGIWYK